MRHLTITCTRVPTPLRSVDTGDANLSQVLVWQYGRYWTRTSDPLLVEQGKEEVEFFGLF